MESVKNMIIEKNYYPRLWKIERLKTLVENNKLTVDEFKEITGEDYNLK